MKNLSLIAATVLPASALVSGFAYNSRFGRPTVIVTPRGVRGPCADNSFENGQCVDRAFDDLKSELNENVSSIKDARRERKMTREEAMRQQQDWANRAFGLASEVASGMAAPSGEVKEGNEAIRQQQEWFNRAFGLATDVASGNSSPRYEMNDTDEAFQVEIDVPGIKLEDIDITVEENGEVLTIRGQREVGKGEVSRIAKLSKSFNLDPDVDIEKITAQLSNGVLSVSAPKVVKEEKTKKIPVKQVTNEAKTMGSDDSIEAEVSPEDKVE